jgi:hypothetical protein
MNGVDQILEQPVESYTRRLLADTPSLEAVAESVQSN